MVSVITVIAVIILDQLSKLLCVNTFDVGQTRELIPEILNLTYVQNRGAAFGMLSQNRWVFMIASALVIVLVCFALSKKNMHWLYKFSLSLVLGGGIGNMIDRVRLGYVIDFIDFRAFDFWKWVFNIADSAVTVGCILFIIYLVFFDGKDVKKASESESHEQ